ncbi:MAG: DUF2804 domain-containing protein [Bradymonadaceae bacterium]|nr:DUF2804 domain-containing protein [Lujinxingiaceae bacterium]
MTYKAQSTLARVPASIADAGGQPRFGTFEGELVTVDLSRLRAPFQLPIHRRILKHKRWQYAAIATEEVLVVMAVIDATYAASGFIYAIDRVQKRVLFDHSFMGLPGLLVHVGDQPGAGHDSRFRTLGAHMGTHRGYGTKPYVVEADIARMRTLHKPGVRLRGEVVTDAGGPALTVIAPVPEGVVNITQKWLGLPTQGVLEVGSRRFSLDGGLAGLDYTQGYLARRTSWRWALALGRLADGTSLGINLVEGFNESSEVANENALWLGDRLIPLGRARFEFDKGDPGAPWRITTSDGVVDLSFEAIHVHTEHRDLKVLTSYFVQPCGLFEGTIKVDGHVFEVHALAGVTEDQDVYW